jgi:hypothetical protein
VLRDTGSHSIRQLAQATGIPKSRVDRHCKALYRRAQEPAAVLWQQAVGYQWLQRLVFAVVLVFGIKSGVGAERLSEFFQQVRLGRYVGSSPTALRQLRTHLAEAILAYRAEQGALLRQVDRDVTICAGADETFFDQVVLVMMDLASGYIVLEETAEDRRYGTWHDRLQTALAAVGIRLQYVVSDRAKALVKLALAGFGCPSIPDLFHVLRDLAKVMAVGLPLKLARVEEQLTQAHRALQVAEAKRQAPPVQRRLVAHLVAEAASLRADQAAAQAVLHQVSQAVHPFAVADSRPQTSAQVEAALHQGVATLSMLRAHYRGWEQPGPVATYNRQIAGGASLVDAWWCWVEQHLTPLALDADTQGWLREWLLPTVYWQVQVERTKTAALKVAYQAAFQQAHTALLHHPLSRTLTSSEVERWHTWARDLVAQFQRASSPVEGRNGYLSQLHQCRRGTSTQRLKVMTVIHNFALKRADGTTAAERLFRTPFPDLFDWVMERMGTLPVPRKARPPSKPNLLN